MQNKKLNKYLNDQDFPIKQEIILKKSKNISLKKNLKEKEIPLPNKVTKKKRKKNIIILISIYIICLSTATFCFLKLKNWYQDNHNTNQTISKINEITNIKEINDNENTELINEAEDKESDYWYYIKFPLIQVNFNELKKKNSDTIAWIQVNNTNINYPVVQTSNNNFYLTHSYDKSNNEAGWVFMDFRNNPNFSNKNTIIYAHSRLDKTMFGSLSQVLKQNWYQNKDNHIIKISTPTENSLWQIFSVYKIKEETYYITTNFINDNTYLKFLTTLKNRSKYNFDTTLSKNDKILTLSTCYSDTERTVVHAKMIKKSPQTS